MVFTDSIRRRIEHNATNKLAKAIDQCSVAVSSAFKVETEAAITNNGDNTKNINSATLLD